jgi:hypothetical protein
MKRRTLLAPLCVAVAGLTIGVAGCTATRPDGFFVATERPTVMLAALIEGDLVKTDEGDCWAIANGSADPVALLFPVGTTADAANETVDIPSLGRLSVGDRISGGGGYFSPAESGVEGIESCGTDEVAVLNPFD